MPEFNFPRRYSLELKTMLDFKDEILIHKDPYTWKDIYPFHFRVNTMGMIEFSEEIEPGKVTYLNEAQLALLVAQDQRELADSDEDESRRVNLQRAIKDLVSTHNLFAFPPTHTFCGIILDGLWYCEDIIVTDARGDGIVLTYTQQLELLNKLSLRPIDPVYVGSIEGVAALLDKPGVYVIRSTNAIQDPVSHRPSQWMLTVEDEQLSTNGPPPAITAETTVEHRKSRNKRRQHDAYKERRRANEQSPE
jgi:hypothetical protein